MKSSHVSKRSPLNVALLPPPRFLGHLIPFLELANKLVSLYDCTVTLIIPHDGSTTNLQKSLLRRIAAAVSPVFLPPASTADLPENTDPLVFLPICILRSLPAIRNALSENKTAVLVVDLFAADAIDVARELGIPVYVFYSSPANELSLSLDLPELDASGKIPEPVKLPGSVVLNWEDTPDYIKDRSSEVYKLTVDLSNKYLLSDGILVNSFEELESEAFEYLERRRPKFPPIFPVGPLVRTGRGTESNHGSGCLMWLNDQPPDSVLFVSFGSGGAISVEQIWELAHGLEMSGQRFLWVVRNPSENSATAYLKVGAEKENPLEYLPEGFLERTRGRGLALASWAPQIEVLSHSSTGGFVTHCGWNSILEGVVHGVPLVAWPLCFEQNVNAVFLTDGLKVAIRVKENANGIVGRGEISNVVKEVMEGEEGSRIRTRMNQLKIAAVREGSSSKALAKVVHEWARKT